ncbi:MAG: uracil-DNA glycosylase [Actinomycetota bacterium]|nr:uracil-DNA glycosylase [Actinomycetota bacterium]MDA2974480.1 uracil-DNA glycosylase [Actinomycetota bacterium]MDA3010031.1 uracil-DNA glycosylase [Actinomycetota bacterium]
MTTDWNPLLRDQFDQPYWADLQAFVEDERRRGPVYPPRDEVFAAMHHTSHGATRAVILGQDPYHGPGQAHGLCFSVRRGVARPPSVANIHRELHDDLGVPPPVHGNLERWAAAGVLLLNTTLTVRGGEAGSHRDRGWERFTDRIIEVLSARAEPLVFVLWGSSARAKRPMIDTGRHGVVESAHPSPLSAHRGFLGSRPFSKVNALLTERGADPIDWTLT